jgi:MYXO-CTERM domain-containing protein
MIRSLLLAALIGHSSSSRADQLEVSFDLAQYQHNGSFSFSQGCIANPPTGRTNYVHVTVVWLEDDSGNYVTTLYRWGRTYVYNLKRWAVASDMKVDGITRATPTSNGNMPGQVFRSFTTGPIDISWIPDGSYRIRLESTQCELADEYRSGTLNLFGPEATFNFTKGRAAQTDVNLGSAAPFNNVTVDYTVPAGNVPPAAWAGTDQRLRPSITPSESSTMLSGVVSDDSGNPPSVSWQLLGVEPSGGTAQIASPSSAQTMVSFSAAGIYTFRMTATDGAGASTSDDVEIWVNAYAIDATHDSEVYLGNPNTAMGIIENSGPWVWGWGRCNAGDDYSRGYFRFDVRNVAGAITYARLRLPWAEGTPSTSVYHDFYLLTDAQDDWNGGNASTDWEATITFNNQPVPMGMATNLDPQQLIGSFQHQGCLWRHGFNDPDQGPDPASECPGWVELDLDLATVAAYDTNDEWSIFITPRTGCMNGLGSASRENLINPNIVLVEHWQTTVNQPPTANAGADRVVTDALPAGSELVTLDGSASSDDVGVVTYTWRENGQVLGSSGAPMGVTVPLSLGVHDIELTVVDGAGLTATDTVEIVVEDRFYPNHARGMAAVIDGDPNGKLYDDLFAYTQDPSGDWYAIDLIDGSDLGVSITMATGDLDVALYDSAQTLLESAATSAMTESLTSTGLTAGRYYVQVTAKAGGASGYEMTVDVDGPTLTVTLTRSSAVESAGTLSGAGTVTIPEAASSPVMVTLMSSLPSHLGFGGASMITIAQGATSASFDVVLTDDPPGAPDAARYVDIVATAAAYNRGSAVFEILDDEATLVVTWDKTSEMVAETRSPLIVLTAELSGPPTMPVTVPFTIAGTAKAGSDFTVMGSATELTITGGVRAQLLLSITDDMEDEEAETLIVTMGAPNGASPGSITQYTLTIEDDDTAGPGPGPGPDPGEEGGCGCTASRGGSSLLLGLFGLSLLLLRRR